MLCLNCKFDNVLYNTSIKNFMNGVHILKFNEICFLFEYFAVVFLKRAKYCNVHSITVLAKCCQLTQFALSVLTGRNLKEGQ